MAAWVAIAQAVAPSRLRTVLGPFFHRRGLLLCSGPCDMGDNVENPEILSVCLLPQRPGPLGW